MDLNGSFVYDTEMRLSIRLKATRERVALEDVVLRVPFAREVATYMMGFGQKARRFGAVSTHADVDISAGEREENRDRFRRRLRAQAAATYSWQEGSRSHMVWMGNMHGGMRVKLVGDSPKFASPMHTLTGM